MALMEEEEVIVEPAPPKKKRLPLMIGLAVAVLLVAGGGFYLMRGHAKPASGADASQSADAAAAKAGPELFLPLDPAFVVNFRDDDSMRYLQVGVTLMAHDQGALDTVKSVDPVVRNALLMLFSRQDYAMLTDPSGKQKLQEQALAAVRKIVAERTGKPGIDALYFTSFVMQ